MTLLAIDTATQYISIALHDGQQVRAEQTWFSQNHHSAELAPAVATLLDHAGMTPDDLVALAVSIGPGSYTGLRIGVALAKGIASAKKLPLVGVSTLDVLASGQPPSPGALILVLRAGRDRVTTARYHWRKGNWKMRGEPQNMDWDTLIASIDGPACISGEVGEEGYRVIEAAQREQGLPITLAAPVLRLRRASFLAETAWTRLRAANADETLTRFNAAAVAPIYVKTKDLPA